MDLKIHSIQNRSDQSKEYIDLVATSDCDIGRYQLADSTYTAQNLVSNKLRHVFWLPDKIVKAGEYFRVFTGTGTDGTVTTPNGSVVHKIYWNLKQAVRNDASDTALLMKIEGWQQFKVT